MFTFSGNFLFLARMIASTLLYFSAGSADTLMTSVQDIATEPITDLSASKQLKRQMKGGETHHYRVTASGDQFLRVVTDQLGIDVVVIAKDPTGKPIIEIDSFNGNFGPEYLDLLIQKPGNYRIDIQSRDRQAPAGEYTIKIDEQRQAQAGDQNRILAQRLFVEGIAREATGATGRHEAIVSYEKAAATAHESHDPAREGAALHALATAYSAIGEKNKALEYYRQALTTFDKLDDPSAAPTALLPLALLYREQGNYRDSEQLLLRAKKVYEQTLPSDHLLMIALSSNLGEILTAEGNYTSAELLLETAVANAGKTLAPGNTDFATLLSALAVLHFKEGKLDSALDEHKRALKIREQAFGDNDAKVAESVNNLAAVYWQQGKYDLVEPLLQRSLKIYENVSGPDSQDVGAAFTNLATLYQSEGKYAVAEPFCQRGLSVLEKALGSNHPSLAGPLNTLGELYRLQGKYSLAEPQYQRSLKILATAVGTEYPDYATIQGNLALLYDQEGKFAAAISLYRHALEVTRKSFGEEHPQFALLSTNLANVYKSTGQYTEAVHLIQIAAHINEKTWGSNHPFFAISLENLAGIYILESRYSDAEPLLQKSVGIFEKSLGVDHPNVAATLDLLAVAYSYQKKFKEAETTVKKALAIREKVLGEENPDVANSLNNLAAIYHFEGLDSDCEQLLRRTLEIREKVLPPNHPELARSINNLARLYHDEGRYENAEPLYRRSLAMRQLLGENHPDFGNSLMNVAEFYYARKKEADAISAFDKAADNLKMQFREHFTYMNEKDRLAFLDTVSFFYPMYSSFAFTYRNEKPDFVEKLYDLTLWHKGIVASSMAVLRSRIVNSGDTAAVGLLEELSAKKTQLSQMVNAPGQTSEWRSKVDQLQQQVNDLERQLVQKSAALSIEEKLATMTWRDVQAVLRRNEAAVEFVRFPFHDGKTWTDKMFYIAMIVRPEMTAPALVFLGEASALEGSPIADYRDLVAKVPARGAGKRFYQAFWKPLESYLTGRDRVYISPDGVLNQISFSVVPTASGGLMIEKYNIVPVFSTKDLLRPLYEFKEHSAVLIGNPKFSLDAAEQKSALQHLPAPSEELRNSLPPAVSAQGIARDLKCSTLFPGSLVCPLPATGMEVNLIFSILKNMKWQVAQPFVQEQALEEVVKHVRHPRVLHIATHGFFVRDPERTRSSLDSNLFPNTSDPMLRAGLLFAGAERALKRQGSTDVDMDDGILTAYEASEIDLQGTELVVLSACETGLGEIRNGEEVFGLRRAFQEAGASSVLMSMWSASDDATSELMVRFYDKWLSGKDKHEALREAQLELRKKIKARNQGEDRPYYWGAFVLMGR